MELVVQGWAQYLGSLAAGRIRRSRLDWLRRSAATFRFERVHQVRINPVYYQAGRSRFPSYAGQCTRL
jgi:hypothetical protein